MSADSRTFDRPLAPQEAPWPSDLTFRALAHFLAVADTGSFSAAASKHSVTQPAITYSVLKLEHSLGVALVVREGRRIRLTDPGHIFSRYARSILSMATEAAESAVTGRRRLVVGVTSGLAPLLSTRLVTRICAQWPAVRLSLVETPSDGIRNGLEAARLHIGLGYIPPDNVWLDCQKVAEQPYHLVGRPDRMHALGSAPVAFRKVASLPLVLLGRGSGQRLLLDRAAAVHGLRLNVVTDIDSAPSVKNAVSAGLGFSVFTLPAVKELLEQNAMAALPIIDPPINRPLYIAWRRPMNDDPLVVAIRNTVAEEIAREPLLSA
ncbi:LysR family transcriptional regulator [Faunimonas sp. B44]|uniref:LysR family transcriptional regulator n=1 Tax=Faunimonas sp. B44 TaxID=3461493 RepID=UPI0040442366